MAATLMIRRCGDKVEVATSGRPLASELPLGKGKLKFFKLPGGLMFIAWEDKHGNEQYRFALKEDGEYFVSPSEARRSYSEEEMTELEVQRRQRKAEERGKTGRTQDLLNRGRTLYSQLASINRTIQFRAGGREFFDKEGKGWAWRSDGEIKPTSSPDNEGIIQIVIFGGTWAFQTAPSGAVKVIVTWGGPTDDFFLRLGTYQKELADAWAKR